MNLDINLNAVAPVAIPKRTGGAGGKKKDNPLQPVVNTLDINGDALAFTVPTTQVKDVNNALNRAQDNYTPNGTDDAPTKITVNRRVDINGDNATITIWAVRKIIKARMTKGDATGK